MSDFLTERQAGVAARLVTVEASLTEAVALGEEGQRAVVRIYEERKKLQEEAADLVNIGKLYPTQT